LVAPSNFRRVTEHPSQPLGIDWNNPITNGLGHYAYAVGFNTQYEAVSGKALVNTGSPIPIIHRNAGLSNRYNGYSAFTGLVLPAAFPVNLDEITFCGWMKSTNSTYTGATLVGYALSTNSGPLAQLWQGISSNSVGIEVQTTGANYQNLEASTTTTNWVQFQPCFVVATRSVSRGTFDLFIDGKLVASVGSLTSKGSVTADTFSLAALYPGGSPANQCPVEMAMGAAWPNRALTRAECVALSANPWQLLKSNTYEFQIDAVAGGGGGGGTIWAAGILETVGAADTPAATSTATPDYVMVRLPVKRAFTSQPQVVTRIDKLNPFAKDLLSACYGHGSAFYDAVSDVQLTPIGATNQSIGQQGLQVRSNGGSAYCKALLPYAVSINLDEVTVAGWVQDLSFTTNFVGVMGWGLSTSASNSFGMWIASTPGNKLGMVVQKTALTQSNFTLTAGGAADKWLASQPTFVVITRSLSRNEVCLFFDGVLYGTLVPVAQGTTTFDTIGMGTIVRNNSAGLGGALLGNMALGMTWGRALTRDEAVKLTANPYQVFKAPQLPRLGAFDLSGAAAGPNIFSSTQAETITTLEAPSSVATTPVVQSEAVTPAETPASTSTSLQSIAESGAVADSPSGIAGTLVIQAEAVTATATSGATAAAAGTVAEAGATADNPAATMAANAAQGEAVTAAESNYATGGSAVVLSTSSGAKRSVRRRITQPQQGAQIDWSNPLTKGLSLTMVGGFLHNFVTGQIPSVPVIGADGVKIEYTKQGRAFSNVGGNHSIQFDGSNAENCTGLSNATLAVVGTNQGPVGNSDTTGQSLLYVNDGNYRGAYSCNIAMNGYSSQMNLGSGYYLASYQGTVGVTATNFFTAGLEFNVVSTFDAATGVCLYGNGKLLGTAPGINNTGLGGSPGIGMMGNTSLPGCAVSLACVWNRTLSASEAAEFMRNPWQIFKMVEVEVTAPPPKSFIYSVATRRTTRTQQPRNITGINPRNPLTLNLVQAASGSAEGIFDPVTLAQYGIHYGGGVWNLPVIGGEYALVKPSYNNLIGGGIPSFGTSQAYAVTGRFYRLTGNDSSIVCDDRGNFSLYLSGGKVAAQVGNYGGGNDGTPLVGVNTVTTGVWHTITLIRVYGLAYYLYLDGKQEATLPESGGAAAYGAFGPMWVPPYDGSSGDLAISFAAFHIGRNLTPADALALHANPWQIMEGLVVRSFRASDVAAAGGGITTSTMAEAVTSLESAAATGTFGVIQAEAVTSVDGPYAITQLLAARTEAIAAADTPATTVVQTSTQTEAVTSAESPSATNVSLQLIAEAGAATDTPTAAALLLAARAEAVTGVDSTGNTVATTGTASEAVTAADTTNQTSSLTATQAEAGAAAASPTAVAALNAQQQEAAALAESLTNIALFAASLVEGVNAVDTTNFGAGSITTATMAEAGSLSESLTNLLAAAAVVAESGAAADTTNAANSSTAVQAEAGAATDSPASSKVTASAQAESVATLESSDTSNQTVQLIAESTTASDSQTSAQVGNAVQAEAGALTDTRSAIQLGNAAQGEGLATSDSPAAGTATTAAQAEAVAMLDTPSQSNATIMTVAEAVAAVDSGNAIAAGTVVVSEPVVINETMLVQWILASSMAEAAAVADSANATQIARVQVGELIALAVTLITNNPGFVPTERIYLIAPENRALMIKAEDRVLRIKP
jgi:hypothetical protein